MQRCRDCNTVEWIDCKQLKPNWGQFLGSWGVRVGGNCNFKQINQIGFISDTIVWNVNKSLWLLMRKNHQSSFNQDNFDQRQRAQFWVVKACHPYITSLPMAWLTSVFGPSCKGCPHHCPVLGHHHYCSLYSRPHCTTVQSPQLYNIILAPKPTFNHNRTSAINYFWQC